MSLILFTLMIAMVIIVNSVVVTRYAFSFSPSWTEEITRYAMVWMVMLGAAVIGLFEDHIGLYLLRSKISPRLYILLQNIIRLLSAAVAALIAWTGFKFAFSLANIFAPGSQISMMIPTLAVPVGATLLSVFSLVLVCNDLRLIMGMKRMHLPEQAHFMDGSFNAEPDEGN
ncbi:TRAP transporter small permease [Polycladidibacter stylochi]|uniref:TRAP transporter small permease n=1 Tax=Polycladidibacter stylochi TaxID=1807766 RepID=UPI00138EEB47|nr:TRAP transporter small permease [Pseudovibrio stylochi]